jgi:flagellin-like protein
MRKGITPIIAIIVLLLITVALAGATWTYLSSYWGGLVSQNIQIMDSYCVGGDEGIFLLRNTGTSDVDPYDIIVMNGTGHGPRDWNWSTIGGTVFNETLGETAAPNEVFKLNLSCDGYCLYRFLVGGRSLTGSVQC